MIRRIINSSLRFRVPVVVAALAVLSLGVTQLPDARRDVYPEFIPPTVEIQTEALGLSALEVEQLITAPLEADLLNGVAWVDDIRSESVTGLSSVTLVFEPGTDLFRARQAVQERLAQAHALPNVSKPPQMLQPASSTRRVMMIGLSSEKLSLIEVSQLARWTIKPRLQGVEGVANVASFGQRDRQLQVLVDPQRLADNNVGLLDVVKTTGNALAVSSLTFLEASTPGADGFIETPNQRLGVRHISPIESAGDLAKVPIDGRPGTALGAVADVVEDHQPLIGDALVNGKPGVLLVVEKLRGANTTSVTEGVEAALANLAPALGNVEVDTSVFRPADYVAAGSTNVSRAAFIGIGLMVALLAFAFYQWRSALVATVAILVALAGALVVLVARGATLNTMVLAGVAAALAVVVDDAVSGTERIVRRLRDSGDAPVPATVVSAVAEMRSPLAYAGAFVILPVLPVYFMGGLFGAFGRPLATSYVIAIALSMLTALVVTPALAVLLFSKATQAGTASPAMSGLGRRYGGLLERALRAPARVLVAGGLVAAVGLALLPSLRQSELPALSERDYLVELEAKPGTSLTEMNRITTDITKELLAVDGVSNVTSHVGRAITGDQVVEVDSAEVWLGIDRDADLGATLGAVRKVVGGYDELDRDILTYQQYALKGLDNDADGPIVVRVYGHNHEVLTDKAKELGAEIGKVDGIADLAVELPEDTETLEVEVDLEVAAEYGIKPGDIRRTAATLLAGIQAGALYYDQKIFEVVVWGTPEVRDNPADVENLLIDTPAKGLVPLSDLAEVRRVTAPHVIEREGAFRRIDISANVAGRSRAEVAADVSRAIAGVDFPLEYRAELLGGYVEKQAAQSKLMMLGAFMALAMLLLLQATLGNWRLGAVVFATLPVALAGGVAAALALGGDISIGATVGLLVVLSLAVRNSILLVRGYQHRQRHDGQAFGPELVAAGAADRFGPTLMSAVAVALAFLPLAVMGDVAGHEVLFPMGVVVIGGLVTAVLTNLVLVPAAYLRFGDRITETEIDMLLFADEMAAGPSNGTQPTPDRELILSGDPKE